jgi:hypothetical protein
MFRRSNSSRLFTALLALAALILITSSVMARDYPDDGVKVEKTGDRIIITVNDDDDIETTVIDLSDVDEILEGVLGSLESSQFQLRLGQDNMLSFAMDDTEVDVDLDVILSQVTAAVFEGLEEINASDWAHKGRRHESHMADADLEDELAKLRAEMRSLRRELKKLKTD